MGKLEGKVALRAGQATPSASAEGDAAAFSDNKSSLVAHTGLEPVISALRGQRVNQLHQCAE